MSVPVSASGLRHPSFSVAIIGAGFSGLAAAYELATRGVRVCVLEAEPDIGGLAGAFEVAGTRLDRFYHHWFTSDREVMQLIAELGLDHRVRRRPTHTAVYYAHRFFKLSTPRDLLRFKPLPILDRFRLAALMIRARRVRNWKKLEAITAREWLIRLGGENVYRVLWEPLLQGKFGPYAEIVSAVWFWNKLKLRGGSRGQRGEEQLAYFEGGFVALADALVGRIRDLGGEVWNSWPVEHIDRSDRRWLVRHKDGVVEADNVISTLAPPLTARLIRDWAPAAYVARLNRIHYLANVCLVLELNRPLSSSYWINVNDPNFPFVAVIEHTNFEPASTYGMRHVVYLSKYLPHSDPLYSMSAAEILAYAMPYLKQMFPAFDACWLLRHHVWRARWAQPIVERGYSDLIPSEHSEFAGLHLCSMAQVYPEDRGTNYAIRNGRRIARAIADRIQVDGPGP